MNNEKRFIFVLILFCFNVIALSSQNESIGIENMKIINELNQDIVLDFPSLNMTNIINSMTWDSVSQIFIEVENEYVERFYFSGIYFDIEYENSSVPEFVSFSIDSAFYVLRVDQITDIRVGMEMQDVFSQFDGSYDFREEVYIDGSDKKLLSTTIPLNLDGILLDTYLQFFFDIETNQIVKLNYGY